MRLFRLIMLIFLSFCEASSKDCNQNGICLGHLIEVQDSIPNEREFNSITDCMIKCKQVFGCKFASFNSKHKTCTLSKACHTVVLTDSYYMHSNINCNFKILVVGGYNHGNDEPYPTIEVLSLKGDENCEISSGMMSNLINSAIGSINGLPTICGGHFSGMAAQDACFQYIHDKNEFVQSVNLQIGVYAAGLAQYQDSFIITGGYDDAYQIVNLAQIPGQTKTWTMPVDIAEHCMMPINDTSYILIGGIQDGSLSQKTFIFSPKESGKKY